MKKFIDFFKNFRSIITILQFTAECLTAISEIYNRYFPQAEPQENKTGKGK